MLGPSHTHRHRETDLVADTLSDADGNGSRRSKQSGGTRDVEETLVDGDPLNQGSEVAKDSHHRVAQTLVLTEVSADELDGRAQLTSPPARHPASDSVGPGLVRSRQDHAPTDGNR